MLNFILWLLFGAIAGFIASYIMKENSGTVKNIILGVIGGFVGGIVFKLVVFKTVSNFSFASILVAVVGACICIWVGRKLFR